MGPRVVVVGAGPAGSALALLLARGGVAVTLVEGRAEHTTLLRGDGLMPSGLEALERMGLGTLLDRLPRRELRAWSFWMQGQPLFTVAEPMGSPVACSLIDTGALLEGLLQEALRQPQFTLVRGCPAVALQRQASGPSPGAQPSSGRVMGVQLEDGRLLPADLVVACDGRGSRLRRLAELERREEGPALEVLWFSLEGATAAPLQNWLEGRFATLVGDGGSCALFGTARGAVRVGWLQAPGASGPDNGLPWPERLARLSPPDLAALWRQIDPIALPPPQALTIQPALAPRWWQPGLLLLGDAAHPMSPVRAQGLNMALRDALLAGEGLLPVLRQEPPPEPGGRPWRQALDAALEEISAGRQAEVRAVQALQRLELGRAERLRSQGWLRRLLAATAPWSGPLLARRWQAGQPTLRQGLPWPEKPG